MNRLISLVSSKLVMAAAVLGLIGATGLVTGTVSAQSNNNSFPTSTADCSNWRKFGNDFRNRGDCVSWVQHHNGNGSDDVHANGYGGGGGGNHGGGLGHVIQQLFSFLANLLHTIFAFLGRLF